MDKGNFILLCLLGIFVFVSAINFFFIDNDTVVYINKSFETHSLYKNEPNPIFNTYYLFFKETFHLLFAILIVITSSIVIGKSHLTLYEFKLVTQKYLFYFLLFYILLYLGFLFNENMIAIIKTNTHNGFRSFQIVKNQYFTSLFKARLGITLPEPSYSGLYVMIFLPFAFVKSKFRNPLIFVLLPVFFLMNSSKYAIGIGLLGVVIYLMIWLFGILKSKRYFIVFPIVLTISVISLISFIILNWERFNNILSGQSGVSRFFSMIAGLEFFWQHPFLGIGIGQYPYYFVNEYSGNDVLENVLIRNPSAQNMLINGLSEFGIAYFGFIIFLLYLLVKSYKTDRILFFSTVFLFFNFNASPGNGFMMIYYWVLLSFFGYYVWNKK